MKGQPGLRLWGRHSQTRNRRFLTQSRRCCRRRRCHRRSILDNHYRDQDSFPGRRRHGTMPIKMDQAIEVPGMSGIRVRHDLRSVRGDCSGPIRHHLAMRRIERHQGHVGAGRSVDDVLSRWL
jgi:hypothetical protein